MSWRDGETFELYALGRESAQQERGDGRDALVVAGRGAEPGNSHRGTPKDASWSFLELKLWPENRCQARVSVLHQSAIPVVPALKRHDTGLVLDDALVRVLGWRAHVAFGDPPQSDRRRWLSGHLQHGPLRTLDAGSGSGAIAIYAAKMGNEVLGLSDNAGQNERAKRRASMLGVPATFKLADLREADVLDGEGPYDQIICFEVIEHVLDDEALLRRLSVHLVPGGRLFLTTPFRFYRPLYTDRISDHEDGGHVRWGYTEADLHRLAGACGLDIEQIDYVSGWLSQKITNAMRRGGKRLPQRLVWAALLPLRALLPLDRPMTRALSYPYLSIAMTARKPAPPERTSASVSVLQSRADIAQARRELRRMGVSFPGTRPRDRVLRRAGRVLGRRPSAHSLAGDPIKSWDVLLTLQAVLQASGPDDAVLDLGSIGSVILPALRHLGYADLHGIDLNPAVTQMPGADSIDYRVGDMMSTPWPDGSFAAITAVSVIEHGLDTDRLLREVRRLLRPGGVFTFSTDFWPEKVDTEGLSAFGLPWNVFDADEMSSFFHAAKAADLQLDLSLESLDREPRTRPIEWNGRRYTFLHAVLRRA